MNSLHLHGRMQHTTVQSPHADMHSGAEPTSAACKTVLPAGPRTVQRSSRPNHPGVPAGVSRDKQGADVIQSRPRNNATIGGDNARDLAPRLRGDERNFCVIAFQSA